MCLFYCQECKMEKLKAVRGIVSDTRLLDNCYKRDKFDKHTKSSSEHKRVSVFTSPSTSTYRNQIEVAVNNEDTFFKMTNGKLTVIAQIPDIQGMLYFEGQEPEATDILIVACSTQPNKIHAFTGLTREYEDTRCAICGKELLWKE